MFAPWSRRTSIAPTSLLLAAQWSGVSEWRPANAALTSAPEATSAAMVSILLGKWPGQSVATWSSVRSLSTLVFARLEFWLSSRFNDLVSPLEIASTAAAACFNDST